MGKVHEKDKVLLEHIDDVLAAYDQELGEPEPVEPIELRPEAAVAA